MTSQGPQDPSGHSKWIAKFKPRRCDKLRMSFPPVLGWAGGRDKGTHHIALYCLGLLFPLDCEILSIRGYSLFLAVPHMLLMLNKYLIRIFIITAMNTFAILSNKTSPTVVHS